MRLEVPMDQVYRSLAEHQTTEPWVYQTLFQQLHRWAEIFNVHCTLDIPNIALRIETDQPNICGYYRIGHDGMGLTNSITLNKIHLERDGFWQVLETLLHEMTHAWQSIHGKASAWSHHNVAFRDKMASFGIFCNRRGQHVGYDPDGLFFQLLTQHKVEIPVVPKHEPKPKTVSKSAYKKWTCGCTNVRVAVSHFHAQCLHCHNIFVRVD